MTCLNEVSQFAAKNQKSAPSHLGSRYNKDGFLPEAGNTIVCHLDTNNPTHRAVLEARARMQSLPGSQRFLFTPVQSIHMTVFEGVIETRKSKETWPSDMDHGFDIDTVTRGILPRLEAFASPPSFSVRAAGLRPTGLLLAGATAGDEKQMRLWRDALTTPFAYRHDNHDAYRFHMTFAYPLDWIEDDHLALWETEFEKILADLTKAAPIIPLRPAAFCTFNDMTWFEELLVLKG